MESKIEGMFDGPILKLTIKLATPILIGNLLTTVYAIADSLFISMIDKSDTSLISGIGVVFPIFFLYMALGMGLMIGVSSLVSRAIGEKNHELIERVADSGLLIAIIIALISFVLGVFFAEPIIRQLAGNGLSESAITHALSYFRYILPGICLMIVEHALFGVLQGEGLTKYMGISMVLSTILNIALDPIFIFVLNMGVKGAALATSISILATTIFIVIIFTRNISRVPIHWNIFKAKSSIVMQILHIGWIQTVGMSSLSISFMILNKLISSISQDLMNAWTLCLRVEQIVLLPSFAVATAAVTMVGQNYGNNNLDRVREIYKKLVLYTIVSMTALSLVYMLFAPFIFNFFSDVKHVIESATLQSRLLSLFLAGVGTAIVSTSVFQATGNPLPSLFIRFIRLFVILTPGSLLAVKVFNLGIYGIYGVIALSCVVVFLVSFSWTSVYLQKLEYKRIST